MLAPLLSSLLMAMAQQGYTPSTPPRVPTVADYLQVCDRDMKTCSDILFDHTWRFSVGEQKVGYCLPQEGDDTIAITGAVVAWLKARPDLAAQPTDPALNRALENLYPCR